MLDFIKKWEESEDEDEEEENDNPRSDPSDGDEEF